MLHPPETSGAAEKRQLTNMRINTLYLTWGRSQQTHLCLPQRNFARIPSSPCCEPQGAGGGRGTGRTRGRTWCLRPARGFKALQRIGSLLFAYTLLLPLALSLCICQQVKACINLYEPGLVPPSSSSHTILIFSGIYEVTLMSVFYCSRLTPTSKHKQQQYVNRERSVSVCVSKRHCGTWIMRALLDSRGSSWVGRGQRELN